MSDPEETSLSSNAPQTQNAATSASASSVAAPNSPPLPAKHTAVAPGPRAARFQKVLDDSLKHTLGKISWENFASCFPTIAAQAPATLKAVQKQMVDRLATLCRKEFESILQNRNVVAKLNELETLVGQAEQRRDEAGPLLDEKDVPVPPHLLPAEAVLAAHLAPHLALQQSQLNAKLQTTQAHNAKLFAEIQKQRADLESLVSLLDKLFADIDGATRALDGVAEDLAGETRTVELEMSDT